MKGDVTIALIGPLNTKLAEYSHAARLLSSFGCRSTLLDTTTIDTDERWQSELVQSLPTDSSVISPRQLFKLGLAEDDDGRSNLTAIIARGCLATLKSMLTTDQLDGIASLGGSQTTSLAASVMRDPAFHVGLPKLCLSTMVASDTGSYVGESDIVMFPSIVDISGTLNQISKAVVFNAMAAMAGMAQRRKFELIGNKDSSIETLGGQPERPAIAVSMFGVTTACVTKADSVLVQKGYEPIVFHATGSGGKSMERLCTQGRFAGVLDITTTELVDEMLGGVLSAGPSRLTAAASQNIPQVVSVGAMDMINFGRYDTVPSAFVEQGRRIHRHNDQVTLVRTSVEESRDLGRRMVEQIAKGRESRREDLDRAPVKIFFPLKGVSAIDGEGLPFEDREARMALLEGIREGIRELEAASDIEVIERESHINDASFAEDAAEALAQLVSARR
ncbi:UPF0261-domain-containing protein [Violaceomyces palustris]|uniref:UPF0261-domain-containing protein n=1 Tax=Violaceomyces palustris TaxID=1673888 RepID=A0ACD0P8U1_9BASI|nr:UPF0261-domain-containing protein [Violaceomyces palustris]